MSRTLAIFLLFSLPSLALAQSSTAPPTPKALPARPPASLEQLRTGFANPPAEYRSMPLWVWNDDMQPARMHQMLQQYRDRGIGGAFVHPRPGLITEYLSPQWFTLWRDALNTGKSLGLLINIYDENSYPSGFAGGHVPSQAPDTSSQYVSAETDLPPTAINSNPLNVAFFALRKDPQGKVTSARRVTHKDQLQPGESVASFRLRRASGNPWTGEFPYVDLTNPRTTPAFLKSTYEAYKREFAPEFGKTIKWAFTDEPLLATAGAYDSARLALPLSFYTLSEFRKRNGYDLADSIASLYWDTGDFRKVRFDYWQTLHDLWKENFMHPMFEWCDRNNLQFTGHWMEHEWPAPWITPDDASLYAYEHVPGIDMLEGTNIRTKGEDPHMLFTIKQVASVSHQLGRRAFCEAYGVAGWDSTFEHYKRFGDWLMVHGINFINQHLSFTTIRGARKRDHPQSFSDVSAWWPYYGTHANHLARVSYISSLTAPRNRLLVLQQTTSGFLQARRAGPTPELEKMRAHNATLNQFLADRQIDFDLGDEYMLEWYGRVQGKRFEIAKTHYDLLVLPPDMANLRHQTLPLLEQWLKNGGEILALSPPPPYIDGRPNTATAQLQARYSAQWHTLRTEADLLSAVRQRLAPRIELNAPAGFLERFLPNGDRALFLTNTTLQPIQTQASIEAASLESWDTVTGKITPAAFTTSGAKLTFPVDLPPAGSALFIAKAKPAAPAKPATFAPTPLTVSTWQIQSDSPNVLVLDYCHLKTGRESFENINTWKANWTIWQHHGFERPAWDNAVQFKKSVLDRNQFDKDSGFTATFHFRVEDGVDTKALRLAVEMPELYKIAVNGKPVSFAAAKTWLDPRISAVPITALTGDNTVEITGRPFDVRMELENIFILGDFSTKAAAQGFTLTRPQPLHTGSWASQGYAFFAGSVVHSATVTVPASHNRLRVQLDDWQGSVAVVELDGKPAATLGWQPYTADLAVAPGTHTVAIRIVSTPRNLLGPFHHPSKPRMRAWPAAWAEFPEHQPAGADYQLIDYGLMQPPAISSGRLNP